MCSKWIVAIGGITAIASAGVAVASHVGEVDPATVPTGFLVAHNSVGDIPVSALARAVTPDGADVFVQHVRLGANVATGWHTHPGPAIVTVVGPKSALTYEDEQADQCKRVTYLGGQGFVDRGFGHVHRAVAGPDGADFYVTYLLPLGSENHVIGAPAPDACSS